METGNSALAVGKDAKLVAKIKIKMMVFSFTYFLKILFNKSLKSILGNLF
jgi:hypothetical protein